MFVSSRARWRRFSDGTRRASRWRAQPHCSRGSDDRGAPPGWEPSLMDPLIVVSGNAVIAPGGFLRRKVRAMSRSGTAHGPVLVVGGGGYIGTYVVEQLLAKGRSVRVLDRLMFGQKPLQDFLANPRFELIPGEATDVVKLVEAMQGASAVVHLAGLVGDPACALDETFTWHENVTATHQVKEAARAFGVRRFIFSSSCS